jgi:hypothetical protein
MLHGILKFGVVNTRNRLGTWSWHRVNTDHISHCLLWYFLVSFHLPLRCQSCLFTSRSTCNHHSPTIALGLTQPLTEMNITNLPGGGNVQPARKADNLTAIFEQIVYKMWEPRRLTALWASIASYRDIFNFFTLLIRITFHVMHSLAVKVTAN